MTWPNTATTLKETTGAPVTNAPLTENTQQVLAKVKTKTCGTMTTVTVPATTPAEGQTLPLITTLSKSITLIPTPVITEEVQTMIGMTIIKVEGHILEGRRLGDPDHLGRRGLTRLQGEIEAQETTNIPAAQAASLNTTSPHRQILTIILLPATANRHHRTLLDTLRMQPVTRLTTLMKGLLTAPILSRRLKNTLIEFLKCTTALHRQLIRQVALVTLIHPRVIQALHNLEHTQLILTKEAHLQWALHPAHQLHQATLQTRLTSLLVKLQAATYLVVVGRLMFLVVALQRLVNQLMVKKVIMASLEVVRLRVILVMDIDLN